jgi:sugar phosphate isomerase/epimerase
MKPIALQLYTLRAEAAQDFPGVLRTVAEMGYTGVEFAGLQGHGAKETRKVLDDLGLRVAASHAGVPSKENVQQIVDTEAILGNKRVIGGRGAEQFETLDRCKAVIEQFNEAAALLKPYGMEFGIHNHWGEFTIVEGKYAYDILMAECPGVFSELDVYWTAWGKACPVDMLKKYGARIPLIHIKDGMLETSHPHTAVGSGKMDIPAIVAAADPKVAEWLIVELDECATDMTEAVRQSYKYLVGQGLASGNKAV